MLISILALALTTTMVNVVTPHDTNYQSAFRCSANTVYSDIILDNNDNVFKFEYSINYFMEVDYNDYQNFKVYCYGAEVGLTIYDSSETVYITDNSVTLSTYVNVGLNTEFTCYADYVPSDDRIYFTFDFFLGYDINVLLNVPFGDGGNYDFVNDAEVVFYQFYQTVPYLIGNINGTYQSGYDSGYAQGRQDGYTDGESNGYQKGYTDGVVYAQDQDQTALTIFTGICTVALLPVNMFLTIFNFEVFGINIGGFISSLLTIAIVVIIIRMVTGKKNDD